jgi:hypothetical protein
MIDRLKKRKPSFFPESVHYKRRTVAESLEDHDYITPSQVESDKDCLQMKEYEEEKDKDYYFMDANLVG